MILAAGAVVIIGIGGTAYALRSPKLELKTTKVNVEYGTTYTPKLKDIVKNYKDFNKYDLEIINKIPNEKDKTYPAVGKYTDTSKIDINTPGQYDLNVTVKDKYNNETKKTGKVTVIAKPVISSNEEVVHETVKNKDGTTSVKTKVQKKQSSNTNRSSNSSSSNNSNSSGNSNTSSGSSSETHKGSLTVEMDPKYHWEGENSYGDGAEISGEDFDKLTGGDWKNWDY